jgi:hypothetical protein
MSRCLAIGVYGYDFKIGVIAELHNQVVCCHALVFSAGWNFHTKGLLKVIRTLLQAIGGDDNVVEVIHRFMLVYKATC